MPIVLRTQKGSELTYQELDGNFTTLETRSALSYIKDTQNNLLYANGEYDFGSNILKYANAIQSESDLANYSPATYHGMTMHVHSTGALYYAHAGEWRKLLTDTSHNNVEGVGYVDPLADVAYDGTLDSLSDVSVSGATSGQVLKYDGTNWAPATDLTADSGSGITLEDLSVSVQTAGTANLAYDNTTGVFSYTPPDLSSYALSSNVPNTLLDLNINDGTNGQVLSTDGAGSFSFIDVSGSGDPDQNLFETVSSDSGSTTADTTTDTLTIAGGTDISTSISGDTLTVSYTGTSGVSTFGELTDVSSAGIDVDEVYESAIVTLRVDNNGTSAYTFDSHYSGDNPTVYAISGTTIAFDLDLIGGHPFELQDSGGSPISTGLVHVASDGTVNTGSSAQGFDSGTLYWRIQESLSGNYQYQCTVHSGMNGTITVKRLSTL